MRRRLDVQPGGVRHLLAWFEMALHEAKIHRPIAGRFVDFVFDLEMV
jgi:hypothetical protein